MINNLERNKKLWLLISGLSLIAAFIGICNHNIYSKVVSQEVLPGTISQDLITIIISLVLVILSIKIRNEDIKKQILSISLVAYLFYGYAIYVIEQLYNSLYILYISIFALSFWSIIYSLVNLDLEILRNIKMSKLVKYLTTVFLIFIPLLFYWLWISQLLPLMRIGEKIEFTYSIFILDMVFVLPAFIISAILIIKRKVLGYIFAPILFFKAFTLLFSVGLGGFLKPLYNQTVNVSESVFYIVLSVIFFTLSILILYNLEFQKRNK